MTYASMPVEPPALTTEYIRSKDSSSGSNATAFQSWGTHADAKSILGSTGSKSLASDLTLPGWLKPTIQALGDLFELPKNWDGYGAEQIHGHIPLRALAVLREVMDYDSPAPSIVPLSDGGIQLEWHRHGRSLEIEFPTDAAPSFFYYEESGGEVEGQVSRSYDQIQTYICTG